MNNSAIEMLEAYESSSGKPPADFGVEVRDLVDGLLEAYVFSRHSEITARADEIFASTDEDLLWKEWDSRWDEAGWPVGFSFDPSEAGTEEEMLFTTAFQMAIDEFLNSDDAMEPEATELEVANWLKARRIAQDTLFLVGEMANAADSVQKRRTVVHRDDRQCVVGDQAVPLAGGNAPSVPSLAGAGRRKAATQRKPAGMESRLFQRAAHVRIARITRRNPSAKPRNGQMVLDRLIEEMERTQQVGLRKSKRDAGFRRRADTGGFLR